MSRSEPNYPLGSFMATNQGHLGLAPQLAPPQEGQGLMKARTGASLRQHLFLFIANSRWQSWSIIAQVLLTHSLEEKKIVYEFTQQTS